MYVGLCDVYVSCGAVIVMSSACVVSCTEYGGSGMSEVYMVKSMDERTPPCGTPDLFCCTCQEMLVVDVRCLVLWSGYLC